MILGPMIKLINIAVIAAAADLKVRNLNKSNPGGLYILFIHCVSKYIINKWLLVNVLVV
jgi:hypothetical protein